MAKNSKTYEQYLAGYHGLTAPKTREQWENAQHLNAHYDEFYAQGRERLAQSRCIGICGPKGSGKSELRKLLVRENYNSEPFAQFLKAMLRTFLTMQGCNPTIIERMLDGDMKETETIYLHNTTMRRAMQTLGTEWRNLIHPELWTSAWERKVERLEGKNIVVDDLRFPHEARAIRRRPNSFIVRIVRDGCKIDPGHASEYEFLHISPDLTLVNNSAPEDMLHEIKRYITPA